MSSQIQPVPIAEMIASANSNDVLAVYGVGSCVVVILYDPQARVGGVLHALLPTANGSRSIGTPAKYVDQGIPMLIKALVTLGARINRLDAYLCGGGRVLRVLETNQFNIGKRNVLAAKTALKDAGLTVKSQLTGGKSGCTIKLYLEDGRVTVKTLDQPEKILNGFKPQYSTSQKEKV